MGSRSLFALRVLRCPGCHARLPVQGGETMLTCEYCDARVQLSGKKPPAAVPGSGSRTTHVATTHYSGVAWVIFAVPLLGILGVAISIFVLAGASAPSGEPTRSADAVVQPVEASEVEEVPVEPEPDEPVTTPTHRDEETVGDDGEPGRVGRLFDQLEEQAEAARREKAPTRNDDPHPGAARPTRPKEPEGPVISVAQAKEQLEPEVRKCLEAAGAHHVSARMGNEKVGGVSILTSARVAKPRVDGVVVALPKTKLGRCMNDAGRSIRTRAFGGNYIIIDVRNQAVPDPLRDLPAEASREALAAAVTPLEPAVRACAHKHEEEGREESIRLRIDGPSGKLISVDTTYTGRAFERCIEPVYRGASYPKVQTHVVKHHHKVQL